MKEGLWELIKAVLVLGYIALAFYHGLKGDYVIATYLLAWAIFIKV